MMGRSRIANKTRKLHSNRLASTQDIVRVLASIRNPKATKLLLSNSGDNVIKCISDAALNAMHGKGIKLGKQTRNSFAKKRRHFRLLTERKVPIATKRKILEGRGFLAILPALLTAVLAAVGPALFNRK